MNILHINKYFYVKGGPERYMFSIADLLKNGGHKVAFFLCIIPLIFLVYGINISFLT